MSLVEKKNWYLDYLLIIVGTGLMALAINSVFDATGLVTGGFSGIAILVKHWTGGIIDGGVPLWLTNITLNIPLFFLGWRIKGFSFVKKALVGEISLSTWLAIQPVWNIAGDDLLLAAVYGGVILGIGIGMVFLGQGTTGGTDMMAALIQKYISHYSIAQIMQFIDGLIVIVGMYVFGIQRALYAIIAVYLVTKVSDSLIEGLKFSKQTFIITEKPAETRMGSGKGSPEYWVAVVKPGRVLFEIKGVAEADAREALRLAQHKLPLKTKIIARETAKTSEGGEA